MFTRDRTRWFFCAASLWLALLFSSPANALELELSAEGYRFRVELYRAAGTASRPAVVLIHGAEGIEKFAAAYRRYAATLAGFGIDAYLPHYYAPEDLPIMQGQDRTNLDAQQRAARDEWRGIRFPVWAHSVDLVAEHALSQPESNGRVALLGFSNGSYIGTLAAASDAGISAFVAFYGGVPMQRADTITHLPPLLELHGDADRNVPLSAGTALVQLARRLGAPAEQLIYPGEGHGFDFQPGKASSADAMGHVLSFLRRTLAVE